LPEFTQTHIGAKQQTDSVAIELNDPFRSFDFAAWVEGDWKYDSEMEMVLKVMPPIEIALSQRIPKPNDPSFAEVEINS